MVCLLGALGARAQELGLDLSEHMQDQLGRTWPLTTGQVIARLVG